MHSATFGDLNGASVCITGGASGIGAALTAGFAAQGARVAFLDIQDGDALAGEIEAEHGIRPLPIRCDVTDTAALKGALDQAEAAHGPITVLVNGAANDTRIGASFVTEADWRRSLAINLDHYFFAAQHVANRSFDAGQPARIVNYSSITYALGNANMVPYVTGNAGIVGLTRALAREWGPQGVRVNAIAPGMVLTERQLELWVTEEGKQKFMERQSLKQEIKPVDLVGTTLFLASDASRMITGQVIAVDAGVVNLG